MARTPTYFVHGERREDIPDPDAPPSKSQLKREMTSLQDLGEKLAGLSPVLLAKLALPDQLATAIKDFNRFNKWEAKRRQMQFIGRLMREIDSNEIALQIESWSQSSRASVADFHSAEKWRDRLLTDPAALDAFVTEHAAADRAKLAELAELVNKAHFERDNGKPPASSRLLFREITRVLGVVVK